MAHSSFGSGWPTCSVPIVTIARDDGGRVAVHAELAELVAMLMDLTEVKGYDIYFPGTWGYACRAIAGTRKPSNHSWGTAVDINAPSNPQSYTFVSDIPGDVVQMWKDHGFRWGGDYRPPTKYDPMHFEFMGSVADAKATTKRLAVFLSGASASAPAPAPGGLVTVTVNLPQIREGSQGMQVAMYQRVHNLKNGLPAPNRPALDEDGVFGPHTTREVVEFQRWAGLTGDGIVGANTWAAILGYSE